MGVPWKHSLFILFCRRFGPRPGKSWDTQTSAHTSSPTAFLPSSCPQTERHRWRGSVRRWKEGGPWSLAVLGSAQALPQLATLRQRPLASELMPSTDLMAVRGCTSVHMSACVC